MTRALGHAGWMARSRFASELPACHRPRSTAELLASGVTPDALRGPRWRRTSRGFYVPAGVDRAKPSPTQRILDASPLLGSSAVLSGWAALFVQGVDALDGLDPMTMEWERI